MSHLTVVKVEIRSLVSLKAALKRLGYKFEVQGSVEDYYSNRQEVDLVVAIPGQRSVGFVQDQDSGVIRLVGDWWGAQLKEKEFLDLLRSSYAREQVLESLEQQGIDLSQVREIEEPDGTVAFEVTLQDDEMEKLAVSS